MLPLLLLLLTSFACTQIKRAAITTSGGGAVHDVFEITPAPGAEMHSVTALDVQLQVHTALHRHRQHVAPGMQASNGSSGDSVDDACHGTAITTSGGDDGGAAAAGATTARDAPFGAGGKRRRRS